MTLPIFGSECAPGIRNVRPAVEPSVFARPQAETEFLRLLDRVRRSAGGKLGVHQVSGRLRLRVPALQQDPTAADAVAEQFLPLPGVRSATPNRCTGSIIVHYDPVIIRPAAVSDALAQPAIDGPVHPGWVDQLGARLIEWALEKLAIALIAAVV